MSPRIVSKIMALSWFPLSLCFFSPQSYFQEQFSNCHFPLPPSLPICCSSANCVVLIVPEAGTTRWHVMTSWLWANQEELTSCRLIQGNRKNSLSNMNFYLAASFLSIQKYSFILIALKTKQLFFFHLYIQNKLHCVHKAASVLLKFTKWNTAFISCFWLITVQTVLFYLGQPQTERLHALARNNNEKLLLSKCGSLGWE